MSWPTPRPGLVVRFSYLWKREADAGREEGVTDRPCAVMIAIEGSEGHPRVIVVPITHSPPQPPDEGVELPQQTKTRLGLDDERSWVIVSEGNDFAWPRSTIRSGTGAGEHRIRISAVACFPCHPRSVSRPLPAPPDRFGHPHRVKHRSGE